jgi:DNA-binding NtrC family response regulator
MGSLALRILVADDDHPYCVLLNKTLTTQGHSVSICNSGDDTIALLQKEQFDIVLLDFKMEGTNGINVLQWMYGKKMKVPVILITGHGSDEVYEEAYKWGVAEYFIKGEFDTVRLPILVEQVYRKHQLQVNSK